MKGFAHHHLSAITNHTWKRKRPEAMGIRGVSYSGWRRPTLPRPPGRSTIGAAGLNCRVRNGNGCGPCALVVSHKSDNCWIEWFCFGFPIKGRDQTSRAISSARLKTLPSLHLRPINLVVSQGPSGVLRPRSAHLGASFPLRCFQRLSLRDVATGHCPWRNSPYTSGHFISVLSY